MQRPRKTAAAPAVLNYHEMRCLPQRQRGAARVEQLRNIFRARIFRQADYDAAAADARERFAQRRGQRMIFRCENLPAARRGRDFVSTSSTVKARTQLSTPGGG